MQTHQQWLDGENEPSGPTIEELNQKVVDVVFRYIDNINDPVDHAHLVKMVIDFGQEVDPICNQITEINTNSPK